MISAYRVRRSIDSFASSTKRQSLGSIDLIGFARRDPLGFKFVFETISAKPKASVFVDSFIFEIRGPDEVGFEIGALALGFDGTFTKEFMFIDG